MGVSLPPRDICVFQNIVFQSSRTLTASVGSLPGPLIGSTDFAPIDSEMGRQCIILLDFRATLYVGL